MRSLKLLPIYIFATIFFGFTYLPQQRQEQEPDILVLTSDKADSWKTDTTIYKVVDNPARYPGGFDTMKVFIANNLRLPFKYPDVNISGKVFVGFTVEKDGKLTDVEIMRSLDKAVDSRVVELIRTMPRWEPATHLGDTVRMRFVLPVIISN